VSKINIVMRATLRACGANTQYGQWPRAFLEEQGQKSGTIAHNRLATRAAFRTFEVHG
jgi:hypothetical protein